MTHDELMAKLVAAQEAQAKAVKELHESIQARFTAPDPKAREAEINALVETVKSLGQQIETLKNPAVRKMVWGKSDTKSEGAEIISFGRFLKAVQMNDHAFLAQVKAPSGQSEGTNADGGFSVPTEFAAEIIRLERQSGIARQLARIFPMNTLTRNVPRELAKPSVSWVGEGTEPSLTKGTQEQVVQTAKKLIAIVPFTDELLEDNNVQMDAFIAEVVAQEMGREEDKQAFVGSVSGNSDPFNGVFFASGTTTVTIGGADVGYQDLVNLLFGPREPYRQRGQFVLSPTGMKKVMKLVDDNNRPIWTLPEAGIPGRILGRPYSETDQIPDTINGSTDRTTGSQTGILFGAFDGLWISPRGGYMVEASRDASNSAGKSAFTLDETWFKFKKRLAINVANPEAFAKMLFPAA